MSTILSEHKKPGAGEEDLRQFLQDISQYPLLTAQEEKSLATRCAQGDEEAIRMMVNSNLRLVVSMARPYASKEIALMDLMQEGSIGLLIAAKKFDPDRDLRFSTYATKWIRQSMSRYVLNHGGLIRVPRHSAEKMRKILTSCTQLQQSLGYMPTAQQIAAHCGIDEQKVEALLELIPDICSLDAVIGDDDSSLQGLLKDLQAPQPYEELVRRELKNTMDLLLGMLTERQQQVLRLRFGMEDGGVHTLEETGAILGISKEGARQLEQRAIEALKKLGAGLGLEDFLT